MSANRLETLAAWYLRFNGYFTTPNFTVHPDFQKRPGGTEVDILAVRFPFSTERQEHFSFERDTHLVVQDAIDFLVVEVKTGKCSLNDTWQTPERKNAHYALRWIGFEANEEQIDSIASLLYKRGAAKTSDNQILVRFACFGRETNSQLAKELPELHQITHERMVSFLMKRFTTGCNRPTRDNWDADIRCFAEMSQKHSIDQLLAWANEAG